MRIEGVPYLNRAVRGADEVAEDGYVGAVGADAPCVHGETELFGLFEINAGVVEFGKAETLGGRNAIQPGRIDRARRPVTAPRAAGNFIELLPIAFLPSSHNLSRSLR